MTTTATTTVTTTVTAAPRVGVTFAAGCAFVGAVLTVLATRHGPALSPDSVSYLAAAHNLDAGRGLLDFTGRPFTTWPPGYPVLLAAGLRLGVSASTAARAVNAAALAGSVMLAFVLLRRHVRSARVIMAGTALVAISPAMLRVGDSVWSDALFSTLVLVFVLALESAATRSADGWPIVVAALAVWPAFFVRYAGLALIPAGMVVLAWAAWRKDGRGRGAAVARVGGFTVLAGLAPLLWLLRNRSETGSAFGYGSQRGHDGVGSFARDLLVAVGNLVVPDQVPDAVKIVLVAGALLALALVAFVVYRSGAARFAGLVPLAMVTLGYLGFAGAGWIVADTDVSARILAPIFVPVVVLGLAVFDLLRGHRGDAQPPRWVPVVVGMFCVWFVFVAAWAAVLVFDHGRSARGYAARSWAESPLLHAVAITDATTVLSNTPAAVALWTGRLPAVALEPGEGDVAIDTRQLAEIACRGRAVLAQFGARDVAAPKARTVHGVTVEFVPISREADGALFRVQAGDDRSGCDSLTFD